VDITQRISTLEGGNLMNELQRVFEFRDQSLRIVDQHDHDIWFVAKDVCEILEIKNSRMALHRLDDEEKGVSTIDTPGGKQPLSIVNESGLYELIFNSRKTEAKFFKKWVKQEVLPSIRKTGQYSNVKVLDERRALIESLKLTADTAEKVDDIQNQIKQLNTKVDDQITLTSGEQRRLQKGVALRVYELEQDPKARPKLFRELHREIKDRFGVASYKDVKKRELLSAINYIENWIPRKVS
jgi:prophage antirepressor-like protein